MDANGSRFWSLQAPAHWPTLGQGVGHARWNADCSALCLASQRELEAPADPVASRSAALLALNEVPRALDAQGVVCSWHAPSQAIVVRSAHLPEAAIALPLDAVPTDLCVGGDGVLFVALPGRVLLHDLRRRWAAVDVTEPGFAPWRLAAHPDGGVWVLERGSGRLARLKGCPLPSQTPATDAYAPGVFRPDPENCRAPALSVVHDGWSGVAEPLALACHASGGLLLMGWNTAGQAWVRRWHEATRTPGPMRLLRSAWHAHALTWIGEGRIAVRMPGRVDAPAFAIDDSPAGDLPALGEVYPLASDRREAPFVHRPDGVAHYPVREDAAEPLFPLALPNLARSGTAASFTTGGGQLRAQLIDSGTPATTWHRVFMEASFPPACGVVVWLAATNDPQPPAPDRLDAWHPHAFGRDVRAIDPVASGPHVPHAVWEPAPSELPAHPGLAPWPPQRGLRGLFSVLVQNARTAVRSLNGRYLWVRLSLHGDGRASPEVVALRAWASRFNYAEHYLPRIYRETLFGDAAQQPGERLDSIDEGYAAGLDAGGTPDVALLLRLATGGIVLSDGAQVVVERAGRSWLLKDGGSARCWRLLLDGHSIGVFRPQSSPADFLARSLANVEGVLTQLEDRVAHAHLLTDPTSTPTGHLDWLANWVGLAFDPVLPEARRRAWLQAAPELARWHGTRRGLALALDVATGGAVSGGEVVVLEDFRLRRLLATLLGVDLADEDDPLLPGLQVSGNSVVGDTLVLGDQARAELMALYREEATSDSEDQAIADFYGRLAHRATVLVHREVDEVDIGLIRRIVAQESPAHVQVRVATASWPFMVGVASLVGVDTYLARAVPPRPVRVQRSVLGGGDFVLAPTTLDPRLRGEAAPPPVDVVQPLSVPRSRKPRPRKE
ncbi:phage tail protein [Hydrogenophaga sp.]|uniref:phage tail protein n=1 Tax=Hydrogenophaga sp. TaxID=1904254 RepID=UPI002730032C|nr:phage tail protein [Hydrogenophaga sp.]MDP2074333.1 phage tail protein [Hydrogenophaga sp.]MDP3109287.1 phage tail protein [Hydrogenophaga sp.]MDP3349707.1 phage tail protein [Hydrogenophaga sp.]